MANASEERAARAHETLAASAGMLKASAIRETNTADRRTALAADRTLLAAERTYAAGRTGLAGVAAGIGARALLDKIVPDWLIGTTGSVLILFSGFCFVAAIWRELAPGTASLRPDVRRLPTLLLVAMNGFLLLVSLAALVGIWR